MDKDLFEFTLRMGDNALILAQRNAAWCGHAPALEEDIAMANVGLDLLGQAKLWLTLAGEIEGRGRDADALAYFRDARAFRNCLLVEQPGDYAAALMRQFLFDAWHLPMLSELTTSSEPRVAEIAGKAVKEAEYHLDRSHDLIVRLGDGHAESHARMQAALDDLWRFVGELTTPDVVDEALRARAAAPDLASVKAEFDRVTDATLREATLAAPRDATMRKGGKTGYHSEEFGYALAEMQFLQRAYPGAAW